MDKKKLAFVIIGTLLAMALVVAALVLWLVPGGNGNQNDATQPSGSAVTDNQNGEEGGNNQDPTQNDAQEPTVGVEVEIPGENTGNGNSGNTGTGNGGNGGNSGNGSIGNGGNGSTGNGGNQGGNNEIDFDDLLGNS
jgi:hypothetical protein